MGREMLWAARACAQLIFELCTGDTGPEALDSLRNYWRAQGLLSRQMFPTTRRWARELERFCGWVSPQELNNSPANSLALLLQWDVALALVTTWDRPCGTYPCLWCVMPRRDMHKPSDQCQARSLKSILGENLAFVADSTGKKEVAKFLKQTTAVVEESTGDMKVKVKFATLGKGLGVFSRPIGKAHEISRKSILEKDLESSMVEEDHGWLKMQLKFRKSLKAYKSIAKEACGIAASKCSEVIQIVSKNMFGRTLDLPHRTTADLIVEEARALAKLHVAECLKESSNATLHSDGTSRQKKKFVGQQLTLDDGRLLSVGFKEVATEDAQTLLETTADMLEELSELYNEEKDNLFLQFISKITSTMSDRAQSVMKSFSQKFGEMRNLVVGENVRTTFVLQCSFFIRSIIMLPRSFERGGGEIIKHTGSALGCDKSPISGVAEEKFQPLGF
ncbi:hypothetical protein ElyMa_001686900 [Elysia marginata]|uniref:Uncharacterized protein n=1 Tax=Elysia marginata TaxID=1093978 RepID=A0AAV4JTU5_9GAST|nr:hypothetical protein ElyMa_001686900 [Elysia marginata]